VRSMRGGVVYGAALQAVRIAVCSEAMKEIGKRI
jgi:hypothetical protein